MFHNPKPSFFQPLIPTFESNFSIPNAFNKYLKGEKEGGKKFVTLKGNNGITWEVKVDYDKNDDKFNLKEGWKKFCEENKLQIGEFLVFKHVGNWVFDVRIFDHTYCERQLSHFKQPTSIYYSTQGKKVCEISSQEDNCCRLVVKSYSMKSSTMPLPNKFARENGLNKRVDVMIVDNKGHSSPMEIRLSHQGISYIARWAAFQRAQNLKTGDSIVLEVIEFGPTPILKLHVL